MAFVNGFHQVNGTAKKTSDSIEEFLQSVFDLTIKEVLGKGKDRDEPVVRFQKPEELKKILNLTIQNEPQAHKNLLKQCSDILKYSVKTGHPHFFNQLYAGLDPYGFAGQIITDALNTSIYTYEVAPVFTLIEQTLLDHFSKLVGYSNGDGTFSPGGSYSNMLGMNLARFHKCPAVKEKGLCSLPRMVAFVSKHSHYSSRKNASLLGLGSDNVIPVECDEVGRMKPAELERRVKEALKENAVPFLVVATSGTTVLGAFDSLNPIADICQQYDMWLHVDAAWGGSVLLSQNHKHLCQGIERSDSVAWNPHKMAMAPLQCCMFITKHLDILSACHSTSVPYLFQKDKRAYDPKYDVGSKVVQCGRKVDALKLWVMWSAHGSNGLANRIDKAFENSRYLLERVRKTEGFKLVSEPEATNICFWYVPKQMRKINWDLSNAEFCRQLTTVAPRIKEKMTEKGSLLIGYQPLEKLPNFFRMVVINDDVTHDDMDFVIQEIASLGEDL